jgi:integrase
VNKAFSQAVKWNEINSNPVVEADPPSIRKPEIEVWSKDNVRSFLDTCKNERHYITFLLAISTGMRRGELLGLRWCDIDLDDGIIHVNKSLANIPGKGNELGSLKTRSAKRQIQLHDTVVKELRKHKENQDEWKRLVRNLYEDRDLVICSDTGSFQDPRNVIRVMKRIIKTANVPTIRFHDLRHTHASIMISQGLDIVWVSARLGHANPRVTLEYYAHLLPGVQSELEDIFQITPQG